MTDSSPHLLQATMQNMEDELAALMNEWSDTAEAMVLRTAAVERLKAPERLRLKVEPPPGVSKPTKEDLDALVLNWLWTEHEQEMVALLEAEARNAALETKYKVATKALSSKQTRLNADMKLHGSGR